MIFDNFCEEWLDLKNIKDHIDVDQEILVDFEYFLQVLKTIFFWKKMRFETERE